MYKRQVVADALSRPTLPDHSDLRSQRASKSTQVDFLRPPVSTPVLASVAFPEVPELDFAALAKAQDPGELVLSSGLQLLRTKFHDVELWCDTSGGWNRPLIPLLFRRQIFEALHGLSHPGSRLSIKLISAQYVWPGLRK